mmetsp:Transcript_52395/g.112243  ORF Transcript_52395/g.112243 Transcript_52395/m.112243 type:complete len:287 (+) Transcript_52395:1098-1958(+)
MHAEEHGTLRGHVLNVLPVLLVGARRRGHAAELAVCVRHQLGLVQELFNHEEFQVGLAHDAIPVVHNVAPIHHLPKDIPQIRPGDLHRLCVLQIVVQHRSTVSQISQGERVHHVVSQGAKLLPLQHYRMEMAEAEDNGLHLCIPLIELLLVEEGKRPPEVGRQPLGRFVCELQRPLQDPDRNTRGRVGGQEQPQARMGPLHRVVVQLLLQSPAPLRHEVDILQHDPVALLVPHLQLGHGHHVLALAHGNVMVVHVYLQLHQPLTELLHLLHRVSSGGQDEKDGRDC